MFQKLKRKCRPTTILLAIGFSISIMSVLVGISAINDILTSLAEADQEAPIFNTMQNTGFPCTLNLSVFDCELPCGYKLLDYTKRRDMAIRKAFGWSNRNLIFAVVSEMAEILLVSLCIGFILIEVFSRLDRGSHIHSYNTFFPMWYASALASYIVDFRYHSCYSHFEKYTQRR